MQLQNNCSSQYQHKRLRLSKRKSGDHCCWRGCQTFIREQHRRTRILFMLRQWKQTDIRSTSNRYVAQSGNCLTTNNFQTYAIRRDTIFSNRDWRANSRLVPKSALPLRLEASKTAKANRRQDHARLRRKLYHLRVGGNCERKKAAKRVLQQKKRDI